MTTMSDEKAAQAIVNQTFGQLLEEFPHDSAQETFERFSKLMDRNPSLREAFLLSGFTRICDQILDQLVRLGKPVPNALKKPN